MLTSFEPEKLAASHMIYVYIKQTTSKPENLMSKKNLIPQPNKPVMRISQGTQAALLAELSEEVLGSTIGGVSGSTLGGGVKVLWGAFNVSCSYDGDD